ncbi:MAG: hypothetical protein JRJ39_00130 [Deltaproteobacteria bacterium]|nr:hypothetical protein [Deltaproteobacteria bacterium]
MSKDKDLAVGDKVRVRGDLVVGVLYNNWGITEDMEKFRNKVVTINRVDEKRYCMIKEDGGVYRWSREMFEPGTLLSNNETISNISNEIAASLKKITHLINNTIQEWEERGKDDE